MPFWLRINIYCPTVCPIGLSTLQQSFFLCLSGKKWWWHAGGGSWIISIIQHENDHNISGTVATFWPHVLYSYPRPLDQQKPCGANPAAAQMARAKVVEDPPRSAPPSRAAQVAQRP